MNTAKKGISIWNAALVVVVMASVFVGISGAAGALLPNAVSGLSRLGIMVASQLAAFGAVAIVVGWLGWRPPPILRESPLGLLLVGVLFGATLQLPLSEIYVLAQHLWPQSREELLALCKMATWNGLIDGSLKILAAVVLAPLTEEWIFRRWILGGLENRYGAGLAWIVSSVLFGLIHGHPTAILFATVAGLVLGAIYLRSRSLWLSVAIHAGVNATPFAVPHAPCDDPTRSLEHVPVWQLSASLGLAALLLWILQRQLAQRETDSETVAKHRDT